MFSSSPGVSELRYADRCRRPERCADRKAQQQGRGTPYPLRGAPGLSERGGNLSGGQRQRLALARGALAAQGSSLLLLDEPTSALDPQAEGRVFDRMVAAFPEACIVASVHRPSLLARFDTVVVVEAGRVVDAGPRDAVLARRAH
ncbi:MAG: ATP-binding cassette domain-containing protein [Methyloversatilis sp.]|nr:ATP-binding cassette domain-containing protein [Methyloversatilis sp.]